MCFLPFFVSNEFAFDGLKLNADFACNKDGIFAILGRHLRHGDFNAQRGAKKAER
jgi:hypothetical protein